MVSIRDLDDIRDIVSNAALVLSDDVGRAKLAIGSMAVHFLLLVRHLGVRSVLGVDAKASYDMVVTVLFEIKKLGVNEFSFCDLEETTE